MASKYKNEAWLRNRYIYERKTVDEIAAEARVTTMTIRNWLKEFKIGR